MHAIYGSEINLLQGWQVQYNEEVRRVDLLHLTVRKAVKIVSTCP